MEKNFESLFCGDKVAIKYSSKMIVTGNNINNLFYIDIENIIKHDRLVHTYHKDVPNGNNIELKTLHHKMGHINVQ